MLFDFQAFIEEMRTKEDKKEIAEKYEKHFGPITGDVTDQLRYKEYLINFKYVNFILPDELEEEFDRKLLLKLVAGSFSSECLFEKPPKKETDEEQGPVEEAVPTKTIFDLTISVKSGDQSVIKKVSELWSFQIMRLYEIYIEEQMNLHILTAEDEKEKAAILSQRQARLQRRRTMLDTLDRDELAQEAKVEQQKSLDDLYGQL